MKVFISWSGAGAQELAQTLSRWLPHVIQAVETFFSADDTDLGARWSAQVAAELADSSVGILVVTRQNLGSPWMMFEAGALSSNLGQPRVVPLLFGMSPKDLKGPLVQFQAAEFGRGSVKRIVRMLNSQLGDVALSDVRLEEAFDVWWPSLSNEITAVLNKMPDLETAATRSDREVLDEVLALSRAIARSASPTRRPVSSDRGLKPLSNARVSAKEVRRRLDEGGSLAGANLMELDLSALDLTSASMRGANLVGANLADAILAKADLRDANLERATLARADVSGADLSRANLWRADLQGVKGIETARSLYLTNLFGVTGLSERDRETVSHSQTLNLGD